MTIADVQVHDHRITFSLAGEMSLGSAPVLDLLIRRSHRMGLSVYLDISGITEIDAELENYLSRWLAAGIILFVSGKLGTPSIRRSQLA